ncbi:hypothetical protein EJA10_05915 [Mesobacillus subterraneus]|uniref:RNA polymerase subunit sigma n=2 Tax=Mesobacillus subterraneus TaxID=285983 RepID=A0A3R9FK65_9BACI|nr:hypothetical protein EJA10_05915 [Mesobacillus subterraneus]
MSLKAIEMQIALPRTQDAGKIQEQIQQRGQHLQDHAAQSVTKEDELKRKTVIKNSQKQEARLNKEGNPSGKQQEKGRQNHANKEEKPASPHHPYKGKVIDYSG